MPLEKTTVKMVWAMGIMFSVQTLCTCLTAAFVNITWGDMSGFKRIVLFIAVVGNWTTAMMAYLSKTFSRLEPQVGAIINGDYAAKTSEQEVVVTKATDDKPAAQIVSTKETTIKQETTPLVGLKQ